MISAVPRPGSLSRTASEEAGFTLPEILVVLIILGLLAAIGYATFLGQRTKASDADAKDLAAAMVLQVKSCHVQSDDYTKCDHPTDPGFDDTGLPVDSGASRDTLCTIDIPDQVVQPPDAGKVAVIASGSDCFVVMASSSDGHYFWQRLLPGAAPERGCAPDGQGGCHVGGTWSKGG
jgi:prepilin-type N-terminal cleavage/methylation domain-containing protein